VIIGVQDAKRFCARSDGRPDCRHGVADCDRHTRFGLARRLS
jgi:hypothetical protein